MRILQSYITRELFKIFILTAVGLTLVFSLCGCLLNMIQAEMLTAVELARYLGSLLPVATTLTLPVAALFSCAIVYGRLAADNEFDACKASGINILWLLAPAFGLSLLTAAFTFSFSNYVIPQFIERIETRVQADAQKFVAQHLKRDGYMNYGPYVLYAGKSDLKTDVDGTTDVLHVQQATFLELRRDTLSRCGTAREVRIDFWTDAETGSPRIEAIMFDVRLLDLQGESGPRYFQERERPFESPQLSRKFEQKKQKPKWLTLTQLLECAKDPTQLLSMEDSMAALRIRVRDNTFYKHVHEQLTGSEGMIRLADERFRYEVRAGQVWLDPLVFTPEMRDVTVRQEWTDDDGNRHQRDYHATEGGMKVVRGYPFPVDMVIITLRGNVEFVDSLDPGLRLQRRRVELEAVRLPEEIIRTETNMTNDELTGLPLVRDEGITDERVLEERLDHLHLGDRIRGHRIGFLTEYVNLKNEIASIVHSRMAFAASALVTLILAAALGIIFRGGQLLTAFVIAFIPGLMVVVINIMGRNYAEKSPEYHLMGIAIIWGGLVLLAAADAVVLRKYLKR
jgi:lipopolysaccharide export LptBFGC system permease protein LptF